MDPNVTDMRSETILAIGNAKPKGAFDVAGLALDYDPNTGVL